MTPIEPARFPEHLALVRTLFREYVDALGVDLGFQDVEAELAGLPGKYAAPAGRVLLAWHGPQAAGCVALRAVDARTCEIKRLYVRPAARGERLGRLLAERVCDEARAAGYRRVCLDTLPTMVEAHALYASMGFEPIEPYVFNPIAGTCFLGKALVPGG